jgi:hypothetical protein
MSSTTTAPTLPDSKRKKSGIQRYVVAFLMVIATCFAPAAPASAEDAQPVQVSFTLRPAVVMEPGRTVVRIVIEPDDDIRAIRIQIDSGSYYRGSQWPVDPTRMRTVFHRAVEMLPAGDYLVRVSLIGPGEEIITWAQHPLQVIGGDER